MRRRDGFTLSPIEAAGHPSGTLLSTIAMPTLSAGVHRIQVFGQASDGAYFEVTHHALAATGYE